MIFLLRRLCPLIGVCSELDGYGRVCGQFNIPLAEEADSYIIIVERSDRDQLEAGVKLGA